MSLSTAAFKAYPQLSGDSPPVPPNLRHRLGPRTAHAFPGRRMPDRIARALAETGALDVKELVESFEFFARVRKRLRGPHVVDLCCGHGLTGMLFGLLERRVERVTLVDQRRPDSHGAVFAALCGLGPWLRPKVRFLELGLQRATGALASVAPAVSGVVAVHACGPRTDTVIEVGVALGAAVAVMPCCYGPPPPGLPAAVVGALGGALATDVQRTIDAEARGREVQWTAIPAAVTPHNRVIVLPRLQPTPTQDPGSAP